MTHDVLMCAGPADVRGLLRVSLRLLLGQCPWVGHVHVITPEPERARSVVKGAYGMANVTVHADRDVCGARAVRLPGWFRQQYIKLHADRVCDTNVVVCVGADTLVLDPLDEHELVVRDEPVLRFFRYPEPAPHLNFERFRVRAVAELLRVEPGRSFLPGDFICDVFPFATEHLRALRAHVDAIYGPDGLATLLEGLGVPRPPDGRFGEWTAYAVFVLDAAGCRPPLQLADPQWARQVHVPADLQRADVLQAHVLHLVHKPAGVTAMLNALSAAGRLD